MRKETLSEKAYRLIKEWVLSGDVEFGELIDQQELVERFGFSSITPVREALILLQKDKLVDIVPRKGVFVSRMSLEEVFDNFQVREIIEPTALVATAIDVGAALIAKYRTLFSGWLAHPETVEMHEYLRVDSEFHLALLAPLRNNCLNQILETIYEENTRYRLISLKQRDFSGSMEEHLGILDALEAGQVETAAARMKEHIQNSKIALIQAKNV